MSHSQSLSSPGAKVGALALAIIVVSLAWAFFGFIVEHEQASRAAQASAERSEQQ